MRVDKRIVLIAGVAALLLAGVALAQGAAAGGASYLAGRPSPWRSAQFVVAAYGAIWVALVLYLWRLSGMARRLRREIARLEKAVGTDDESEQA